MKNIISNIENRLNVDGTYNIVRIVPTLTRHRKYNRLENLYRTKLFDIFNKFNISLTDVVIYDHPNNIITNCIETVDLYNNDDDVDGIMYDFPFMNDKYNNSISSHINIMKDVQCITPHQFGMYSMKMQYKTIPPLPYLINNILKYKNMQDNNKICILGHYGCFYHGIIPAYDDNNIYTVSNHHDNYIIDNALSNYDIIISLLYNTQNTINNDHMIWSDDLNATVSIDFGWVKQSFDVSLGSEIYKDTTCYNLYNGLIDLYIYGVIENLVRLQKRI